MSKSIHRNLIDGLWHDVSRLLENYVEGLTIPLQARLATQDS